MDTPIRTRPYKIDGVEWAKAMMWRGFARLLLILLAVLAAYSLVCGWLLGWSSLVGMPFVVVILLPLAMVARWFQLVRRTKGPKNRHIFTMTRTVEFGPESVQMTTDDGADSTAPWGHFVSAERRGQFLFLFMSAVLAYPVPLHAFFSEDDLSRLTAFLVEKGLLKAPKRR
jgi:hypothetical protein